MQYLRHVLELPSHDGIYSYQAYHVQIASQNSPGQRHSGADQAMGTVLERTVLRYQCNW